VSLIDNFGREHKDLRVSLTDKCNLRCTYCMPAEGVDWISKAMHLTSDELKRVVGILCELGIEEIRLTGGEPLLHPEILEIVNVLNELPTKPEISMTTNATRLDKLASELKSAGLKRLNISLDTLNSNTFQELTRRDGFDETMAGIKAAKEAGFPIKINSVLMRNINDHEAVDLLDWAIENNFELRFIEQMPLDAQHAWDKKLMVSQEEIFTALSKKYVLERLTDRGSDPAELFAIAGETVKVGIIASVSAPFCKNCDRLRLTSDGQLRNCLFATDESDLRIPLRNNASDDELKEIIQKNVLQKKQGHGIGEPTFIQPIRPMSAIGG
jgi:GTP 3',8-cyclase